MKSLVSQSTVPNLDWPNRIWTWLWQADSALFWLTDMTKSLRERRLRVPAWKA